MPASLPVKAESRPASKAWSSGLEQTCHSSEGGYTPRVSDTSQDSPVYFFPDAEVTVSQLKEALGGENREARAWVISHLLRYALWEDIWEYVERDEVREIFPELDLPENLRVAWGRMLKVEAPVA